MPGHVECRLVRESDVETVVTLMQASGVHFAGARSDRVLAAVATDAASGSRHVRIALATRGTDACGLVVSFLERSHYWRTFALRHPFAALEMGAHRLRRTLRSRPRSVVEQGATPKAIEARRLVEDRMVSSASERWTNEGAGIAKIMYVAVAPTARGGGGVGTTLYRWFFRDLNAAGIARCDACVSSENVAALALHRQFPFRFTEMQGGYFLWLSTSEVT